jgi:UDP-N-acetyl-D-mannosaminuronic acid dehydrogenase
MKNPSVIMMGLGYIGLPTAAIIASKNIDVLGVDINKNVVDTINDGKIHIVEPDLNELVADVTRNKKLTASIAPKKADVFLIAVPTPFKGKHKPDISYVESSIKMIIPFIQPGNLIILESTSPVGTTEKMAELIYKNRSELKDKIYIAYCPERVLPGKILIELIENDRVIGGINNESADKAVEFYSLFVKGKLHKTNARTAEMCKLVENSSRDVSIAFANELSMICDKAGIDVWELIELANKHPRVNILKPGAGVGGHCIAVDPWFLVHDFKNEALIIKKAREINNYKPRWVINKIREKVLLFKKLYNKKPKIACMGLSFKADIDDLRESPSLEIVERLIKLKYDIIVVEPNIKSYKTMLITDCKVAVNEADIIVFLVGHKEFKYLDIDDKKIVIDFCGILKKN